MRSGGKGDAIPLHAFFKMPRLLRRGVSLYMEGAEKLIIIDAFKGGQKPGTIYRCTPEDLMAKKGQRLMSLHDVGPIQTFRIAKILGYQTTTVIIGVEPEAIDWGMELSPKIKERMTQIVHAVLKEV